MFYTVIHSEIKKTQNIYKLKIASIQKPARVAALYMPTVKLELPTGC